MSLLSNKPVKDVSTTGLERKVCSAMACRTSSVFAPDDYTLTRRLPVLLCLPPAFASRHPRGTPCGGCPLKVDHSFPVPHTYITYISWLAFLTRAILRVLLTSKMLQMQHHSSVSHYNHGERLSISWGLQLSCKPENPSVHSRKSATHSVAHHWGLLPWSSRFARLSCSRRHASALPPAMTNSTALQESSSRLFAWGGRQCHV